MSFAPRTPVIEGLLHCGTYIFAGSPKIGKSFFMSQVGYHVATGIPLWDYPVRQGSVLYLALEDEYSRLQSRLNQMFGVETVDGLYLAVQSKTIGEGLGEQLSEFVQMHPDTRLIIVDTLQKVRENGNESYSYSADYENITALKRFSDTHNLTILVVHHTRKMESSDSFDMISGTNGLMGAADGAVILQKKKRTTNEATMMIVGRDQPDQELKLEFNREHCIWELTKAETKVFEQPIDPLILKISEFMRSRKVWTGSASELLAEMEITDVQPHVLTRKLNVSVSDLFNKFGIRYYQMPRSGEKREFSMENDNYSDEDEADETKADENEITGESEADEGKCTSEPEPSDSNDAMTVNDAISKTPPLSKIASLASQSVTEEEKEIGDNS